MKRKENQRETHTSAEEKVTNVEKHNTTQHGKCMSWLTGLVIFGTISINDWLIGLVIENGYFEQETLTTKQDREAF